MNNIWFTADNHFGHENIIKYTNRPFSSVDEMDEVMIQKWNEVVNATDTVYHLGDFTLGDFEVFCKYRDRLFGHIIFVPGGHDYRWIEHPWVRHVTNVLTPLFSLEKKNPNLTDDLQNKYPTVFVLCHYAMRVWDRSHYGSFHLYGHSHGTLPGLGRSMDVGVDTNNFYPYSLEEISERLSKIEPHNGVKNEQS